MLVEVCATAVKVYSTCTFLCKCIIEMPIQFFSGGCRKIPGIFYPDGSELAKRSKRIAWRAAVEMSMIVAHLAYQVGMLLWDFLRRPGYEWHW